MIPRTKRRTPAMSGIWRSKTSVGILALLLGLLAVGAAACGSSETDENQLPTAGTAGTPRTSGAPDTPTPSVPASDEAVADSDDVSSSYQRRGPFVPLDTPEFITPAEATFLEADDHVLGVTIDGDSRAYPIRMMTFHHIVNDSFDGRPILITF